MFMGLKAVCQIFYEWKIIPLFLIEKYFRKNFKYDGSFAILQYLISKNARVLQINFAQLEQVFLLYHCPYYLNIYGLKTSKLEKIVCILMIFQIMVSILSVTW